MAFRTGDVILRRYTRAGRYTWLQPMRVVGDDADGLLLWHPVGSDFVRLLDADGNSQHEVPLDRMRDPRLVLTAWSRWDILVLMRPDTAHSVWWFFDRNQFQGWYVNLEDPYVRRADGVDTTDHVLDISVAPDRCWSWKDSDELDAVTGNPLYFEAGQAAAIRAEGERVVRLITAGAYPFDGSHTGFRPDPAWPVPRLPAGWEAHGAHR